MVSELSNRVESEVNENLTTLPPRRERHGKTVSRKKTSHGRERHKTNRHTKRSIEDGSPRDRRSSRQDLKPNDEQGSGSRETKRKGERKGSVIVANVIFCGFLILVGSLLFYTIKHYS